jgi:hypothetical protein
MVAPEYAQLPGRSWQHNIKVDVKGLGLKSRTWETEIHMESVCLVLTSKKGRKKDKVHENHRHMMSIYFVK